jgi:hypothetical protein
MALKPVEEKLIIIYTTKLDNSLVCFYSYFSTLVTNFTMRLLTPFLALALTSSAAPLMEKRDAVANEVIAKLTKQLNDMASSVSWFYPGWDISRTARNALPILDQAAVVLKTMQDGARQVWGSESLGLTDAIAILSPLTTLKNAVTAVTDGLMKKMDYFDLYLTPVVVQQLQTFNVEAQRLVKVIVARLPSYVPGGIAVPFSQPILNALQTTLDAYVKRKNELEDAAGIGPKSQQSSWGWKI